MDLSLVRTKTSDRSTQGQLSVNGIFECYTLERPEVQIPAGTYPIEMTESLDLTCDCGPNHSLSHLLPLLDNVPGRTCIRIHSGNWPRDSEGCILVGQILGDNMILASRAALDILIPKIQAALAAHDVVQISVS